MVKETIVVTANEGKKDDKGVSIEKKATIIIEMPQTVAEFVTFLTEPVVLARLKQKRHIDAVNTARGMLLTKPAAEVITAMAAWKGGLAGPKKDPVQKATSAFASMTKEQKMAALKALQDSMK
jgi:hypothetical protein